MGGLGIASSSLISQAAYTGSVMLTMEDVWHRHSGKHYFKPDDIDEFQQMMWVQSAIEGWESIFDSQGKPWPFKGELRVEEKMQKELSKETFKFFREQLLEKGELRQQARIRSASGPGSAGFLYSIPSEPAVSLNNRDMEGAVRLRLGLTPITLRRDPSLKCNCGGQIDVDHLLTCKRRDEVCNRHNNLVQMWTSLLKRASVRSTFSVERSLISLGVVSEENCGKRVDIVESSSNNKTLFADVTVTHSTPCSQSNLRKFALSDGAAAAEAEVRKQRVYGDAAREVNADFVPLAMESYGRLGQSALQFSRAKIKEFAATMEFGGEYDSALVAKLQSYWWCALSCCLQRGNISIISRRYYKALELKYGDRIHSSKFNVKRILEQ